MSSTNKTAELQLSQFVGTDIPSILTDYNGDMRKIDAGVLEVKQATAGAVSDLSSVTARVTNAEQSISGLNSTVQGIATRVVGAEGDIDALQTSVGNLETVVNTKADASAVTALQSDVDNIEAVVPDNASESNKLVTEDEISGLVTNLTESVFYTATPETGETYAQILQRVMNHLPPSSVPTSLIRIKVAGRIFQPTYDNRSDWFSFGLESGNLDIAALHLVSNNCTYTGLSSSTTAPYIESFDFSSNNAQTVVVSVIKVE